MAGILDTTTTALIGADGTPIEKPTILLSAEDAAILRAMQAYGEREGLQGEMVCGSCGSACEVFVQGDIGVFCDCRALYWKAS